MSKTDKCFYICSASLVSYFHYNLEKAIRYTKYQKISQSIKNFRLTLFTTGLHPLRSSPPATWYNDSNTSVMLHTLSGSLFSIVHRAPSAILPRSPAPFRNVGIAPWISFSFSCLGTKRYYKGVNLNTEGARRWHVTGCQKPLYLQGGVLEAWDELGSDVMLFKWCSNHQ